ncbi:MAG TPA: hypothetical protein VGO93_27910 [Candidatus Xenobia bacterium]
MPTIAPPPAPAATEELPTLSSRTFRRALGQHVYRPLARPVFLPPAHPRWNAAWGTYRPGWVPGTPWNALWGPRPTAYPW